MQIFHLKRLIGGGLSGFFAYLWILRSASARGAKMVGPNAQFPVAKADPSTWRQKAALEVADDAARLDLAVLSLREKLFAERTWHSHLCEVQLYVRVCARWSVEPFPLTPWVLERYVAVLVEAKYASGSIVQYVSAIFRQQRLLAHGTKLSDGFLLEDLARCRKDLLKAVKRGSGDVHRMLPIEVEHLCAVRPHVLGSFDRFLFLLSIVEWFFMLRADESTQLKGDSFSFDHATGMVTVHLGVTKCNQEGSAVSRSMYCACSGRKDAREHNLPVCPFCAAKLLVAESPAKGSKTLRPSHGGGKVTSQHVSDAWRKWLKVIGVVVKDAFGRWLYASHSLRRGGAQALAQYGWPMSVISYFGRWISGAVELYVLDRPMKAHGQTLAASMIASQLVGVDADADGQSFKHAMSWRPPVRGDSIYVLVPEFCQVPEEEDELPPSGWLLAKVVAVAGVDAPPLGNLVLHKSMEKYGDVPNYNGIAPRDMVMFLQVDESQQVFLVVCLTNSVGWMAASNNVQLPVYLD